MFAITLLYSGHLKENVFCEERAYDEDLDDYRSVLADICEVFENNNHISFHVSGFGEKEWPVDCRFDLLSIIEQLPQIIEKLHNKCFDFVLDFYEQGIERTLIFREQLDDVLILCESETNWIPVPDNIVMNKRQIADVFLNLYSEFNEVANLVCKSLIQHPLMRSFMEILPL